MSHLQHIRVEICCDGAEAAARALAAGADRIELCRELSIGGITPAREAIRDSVAAAGNVPVHVLVRPRGGDFVYSEAELQQMLEDIAFCAEAGAAAVVVGALTPEGRIDRRMGAQLVEAARKAGLGVTWHRAIDAAADIFEALDDVLALGMDRILTSGGAPSAWEGRDTLARMIRVCGRRALILPGCGVSAANVLALLSATGATEVHGSRLEILKIRNKLSTNPIQ